MKPLVLASKPAIPGMRNSFFSLFSLLAILCGATTPARATVLIQHTGSNSPLTEQWALVNGGSGAITAGPVHSGTEAWQIADSTGPSGNHTYAYERQLGAAATEPFATGWKLTIQVNVESLNVIPGAKIAARYISSYNTSGTPTADVSNNHVTYGFYLGSTADGYLRVRLIGAATDVYNASATGYQTLVLQWNPGDTGVSLYINGQYILSNYQGMADTFLYSQTIQFGITSSTPSSNVTDWAQVRFETVPEPSSTAFLGIVGAGLIVWIGFRRSRAAA